MFFSYRVIRKRFDDEVIELLLQAKWWDLPHEIIKENLALFNVEMSLGVAKRLLELSERYD